MIEHLVVFRLKATVSETQIAELMKGIMAFKDSIPGIVDVTCGANFSQIAKGYTHGAVIRFVDHAAYENFFPHPVHKVFVEDLLKPILEDGLEVDFEIGK
jgi:hypothetical protein